jgi:parvulin-like peptidyl-prolyl isomerase
MADRRRQTDRLTRGQQSKREREARQRRILYAIVGVTLAAAALVLGYGLYQEYVVKPSSAVAVVNGETITTRDYQAMLRYRQFDLLNQIGMLQQQLLQLDPTAEDQQFLVEYVQRQIESLQSQQSGLPYQVSEDMIDDRLIRQESERRGITVSEQELQDEIERQFGFVRNPPTPTPTPITATVTITTTPVPTTAPMTAEEFEKNYGDYVVAMRNNAKLTEAAFRDLFAQSLYRDRLQEGLGEEVPTTEEQVHARHILVETEEEAQQVIERLQAGEDFAALAGELSTDPGSEGGDLGWFPRGQMVPEFEEAVFALQPGEISDPVQTSFGYHIIELLERDAERLLEEYALQQRKSTALSDWLEEARQAEGIERFWSSDKVPIS